MHEVEITNRQTLSDNAYRLELFTLTKSKNGKSKSQKREVYFRPESTSILLIDSTRKTVLLTRQFRLPVYLRTKKENLLEVCAGMVDEGELPEQCIVREVEEETGYRISVIKKIAEGFLTPASVTEYMHFFVGEYSPSMKVSAGGGLKDEGEDIELVEISTSEARDLLMKNAIHDVKTILLLQHAIIGNLI